VAALRQDYTKAPISEQDRVMLDYVVKLTKDATLCSPDDHARLREAGFDDRGILQITLIASWFNYIDRVADALGVGRDWATGDLIRAPQRLKPHHRGDRA
jgi:alkylhydroperoxidase family enzyme